MLKKTIISVAMALGLASAASAGTLIGNDMFDLGLGNVQSNLITEVTGLQIGNTDIDQTNAVNSATLTLSNGAVGDMLFNDVVQIAAGNLQLNAALSLNGLSVGNNTIDQINATNIAQTDLDAYDDAVGNDIFQLSVFNPQLNLVGIGEIIGLGNIDIAQTNVINSATADISLASADTGSFQAIEFAVGNDITQVGIATFQGNAIGIAQLASLGNLEVDQINAVNVAQLTITDAEVLGFNDVTQLAGFTLQGNALVALQGAQLGNLDVAQTNVVNSGALTATVTGEVGVTLAVGNDIFQSVDIDGAQPVTQGNVVAALSGIGIGNTDIDQVNAVNVAELGITGANTIYVGNDITQLATGPLGHVTQTNDILLGSVIDVGNINTNQVNVVNSASLNLTGAAFGAFNDVAQVATGVSQANTASVFAVAGIGNMVMSQVNAINVSSLTITP